MITVTSDMGLARRTLRELERKHDAAVIYMRQPDGTVWHVVRGDVEAALRQLDTIEAQRGNYAGTVLHQIEIAPALHLLRSHARGWQHRHSADE
jgi:hypothetical protein